MARPRVQLGLSRRSTLLGALGAVAAIALTETPVPAYAQSLLNSQPSPSEHTSGGMYLLGDSWGAGLWADPSKALGQIAAGILGTTIRVDAVSGTGYVSTAGARNYLQRAATATGTPALVIVQGGSNDQSKSMTDLSTNATATWEQLRRRFPSAVVLALGPGPDPEPVTPQQRAVDTVLESAAHERGIEYVSMFHERWIPGTHANAVIDPITHHPTVQGQAYLGTRLAATIRLHHPALFG